MNIESNTISVDVLKSVDTTSSTVPKPPVVDTHITVPAFWSRFTPIEQLAIQQRVSIPIFRYNSGLVDLLNGKAVLAWVDSLVQRGIITPERAAQITKLARVG